MKERGDLLRLGHVTLQPFPCSLQMKKCYCRRVCYHLLALFTVHGRCGCRALSKLRESAGVCVL